MFSQTPRQPVGPSHVPVTAYRGWSDRDVRAATPVFLVSRIKMIGAVSLVLSCRPAFTVCTGAAAPLPLPCASTGHVMVCVQTLLLLLLHFVCVLHFLGLTSAQFLLQRSVEMPCIAQSVPFCLLLVKVKLSAYTPWRRMGKRRYSCTHSCPPQQGELHTGPLHPQRTTPFRRLGGPQNRSGSLWEDKFYYPCRTTNRWSSHIQLLA